MGRPDRTRRELLDAATAVLTKDSAASLAEVAAAAGVGRTTLHRYFATRDELVRALVEDALDRVERGHRRRPPRARPRHDALRRVVDAVVPIGVEVWPSSPPSRRVYDDPT